MERGEERQRQIRGEREMKQQEGENGMWVVERKQNWIRRGEQMSRVVRERRKGRLITAYRRERDDTHKEDKMSNTSKNICSDPPLEMLSLLFVQKGFVDKQ